ncbi:MAG: imidazole glycerol phosphate synthase subunit HisH [Bacteroidetes bacterium]|nr:MAG: imidazole glycerol phosphate synthase subunit HisH [Bacteroidota bacterium]
MKVSIIKYNGGNIQSVIFALNRLGIEPVLTNNKNELLQSDKIIFPGVGEASSCMKSLQESGLDKFIPQLKQPVLGICVGLQLMCNFSEEGNTKGLGIFDVNVRKFNLQVSDNQPKIKIPQMGWNTIFDLKTSLFDGISENSFIYYVHSFAAELGKNTVAKTNYGMDYSAALQKDNFYAVQFHAEKSSLVGSKILENFITKSV